MSKADEVMSPPLPIQSWQPKLVTTIAACTIGGLLGFLMLGWLHPFFPWPDLPELGPYPSQEILAKYSVAEYEFHSRNGALDCAILGGCLGLFVGLVAASRGRFKAMLASGLAGVLVGGVCGFGVGQVVAASIINSSQQSLLQSTAYHTMIWGPIGASISGVVALLHNPRQLFTAMFAGFLGGIVGAIAYTTVASILFPLSNLSIITPVNATERLICVSSCAIGLGACLVIGLRRASSGRQPQPAT